MKKGGNSWELHLGISAFFLFLRCLTVILSFKTGEMSPEEL